MGEHRDPPEIFLSVACNPDSEFGRMWSANGDGPECECPDGRHKPVRYVRADLAHTEPEGTE